MNSRASFPEFFFHTPRRFTWNAGLDAGIAAAVIVLSFLVLWLGWWYKKYPAGPLAPLVAADLEEIQPPEATTIDPVGVKYYLWNTTPTGPIVVASEGCISSRSVAVGGAGGPARYFLYHQPNHSTKNDNTMIAAAMPASRLAFHVNLLGV